MRTELIRGSLALVLILSTVAVVTIANGGEVAAQTIDTFTDDNGNIHEANIEFIAAVGVTQGCNPPSNTNFCPAGTVSRGQMAAFLARALDLPATDEDFFGDDDSSVFESDINRLAAAGITAGCNPPANTSYCPGLNVTRAQMAAFIERAFKLPASRTDFFDDDEKSIFEGDINRLAASGVTLGCNPPANSKFCPTQTVKRDQMASFLARSLVSFPPNPTITSTTTSSTTTSSTSTSSTSTSSTTSTTSSTTTTTTTMASNPVVTQARFGVYFDGSEAAAIINGSPNRGAVVAANGVTFGIRVGVTNTGTGGPVSVKPKLQYRFIGKDSPPGPIWSMYADVTGLSARVRSTASTFLTVNGATTERLNGPLTFVPGGIDQVDGAITTAVTLGPGQETEFLFSVRFVGADTRDQYEFRLVDANSGAIYDDYSRTPAANLAFTFANGFDTGTDNASIDISDPGDPDRWSQVTPPTNTVIYYDDDIAPAQGTMTALFNRTSGDLATYLRTNDFNQAEHLYGRLYFRLTAYPTPAATRIVDVVGGYEDGDQGSHSITVQADGRVLMKSGSGGGADYVIPSFTLSTNQWYRIEWHATTETTDLARDGTFEVRIYGGAGALHVSALRTNVPTGTEFEDADFGPRTQTITAWIDEVALSNTEWIGTP